MQTNTYLGHGKSVPKAYQPKLTRILISFYKKSLFSYSLYSLKIYSYSKFFMSNTIPKRDNSNKMEQQFKKVIRLNDWIALLCF